MTQKKNADVQPWPVMAQFLADLDRVTQARHPSEDFCADLDRAVAAICERGARLRHDIAGICTELDTPISEFIRTFRSRLQQEAKRRPDHPAFCAVDLFEAVGMHRLEVAHTKAISHLIDPRADHGLGEQLLRRLLIAVGAKSNLRIDDMDLSNAVVESELDVGEFGRIDIYVRGSYRNPSSDDWHMVIEAKVDADEGYRQLERYDEWINSTRLSGAVRIFLTPEGRAPSGRDNDLWTPFAFKTLAIEFWQIASEIEPGDPRNLVRFYVAGVMRSIYGVRRIDGANVENVGSSAVRVLSWFNEMGEK